MSTPLGLQLWDGLTILLLSSFKTSPKRQKLRKTLGLMFSNDTSFNKERELRKMYVLCSKTPHQPLPWVLQGFTDYFWHFTGSGPCHNHNNAIKWRSCLLIFSVKETGCYLFPWEKWKRHFSKAEAAFRKAKDKTQEIG